MVLSKLFTCKANKRNCIMERVKLEKITYVKRKKNKEKDESTKVES